MNRPSSRVDAGEPAAINAPAGAGLARFGRQHALQIGILAVALVIWIVFVIGAPSTFLSYDIYQAFMSTTPFFAVMALPLTLLVIAGEIDLSFPSVMAFGMTAFSFTLVYRGSLLLAFLAAEVAGGLAGLVNGVIVARWGIPSLVATIGTQFFWRGVVLVTTGGNGVSLLPTRETLFYTTMVVGGTGSTLGTFVACFIIGAINAGIVAIGLTGFWTQLIYGLIIVVSVTLQTVLSKKLT